jgi:hypothetical protein
MTYISSAKPPGRFTSAGHANRTDDAIRSIIISSLVRNDTGLAYNATIPQLIMQFDIYTALTEGAKVRV